jgi:dTDP-4-dehydrorhamnose reductase
MSGQRLLLTGAGGQLASAVQQAFADWDVVAHTRSSLDVGDPRAVADAVASARPALVINCAAFNDVDGAGDRPEVALAVNAFALRSLARAADVCGATLVHYGTDFVFDGTATDPYNEESPPAPRSVYASSKLLGEWFGLEAARGFVLRVESLFGMAPTWTGRLGTLDTLVRRMLAGHEVAAFTDRIVTPSYVHDVARATRTLIDRRAAPGLYHCVNSGPASWYDVVTESARVLGLTPVIKAITTSEVTMRAARPTYCALSNSKLEAAGYAMPSWADAVSRWLTDFQRRQG